MAKTAAKWFYSQSKLVQILLLLIPGVNWIAEIIIRWSAFFSRPRLLTLVFAIVATVTVGVFGGLDLVWLLVFGHLLFAKA
jgi:hypothetical protein